MVGKYRKLCETCLILKFIMCKKVSCILVNYWMIYENLI